MAFRKHTLLPLDDCLDSSAGDNPSSDALVFASLRLATTRNQPSCRMWRADKPEKRKFKAYPIGYFQIDIAEVQTAEGKLYLYVAIDRTPHQQMLPSCSW